MRPVLRDRAQVPTGAAGHGIPLRRDRRCSIGWIRPVLDTRSADWTGPDTYEVASGARRFELFERSYATFLGLGTAVDYALDLGLDLIADRTRSLASGCVGHSPTFPACRSTIPGSSDCAIVTFSVDGVPATEVKARLWSDGIVTSVSPIELSRIDLAGRGLEAVVRASVHYVTTDDEVDRLVERGQSPGLTLVDGEASARCHGGHSVGASPMTIVDGRVDHGGPDDETADDEQPQHHHRGDAERAVGARHPLDPTGQIEDGERVEALGRDPDDDCAGQEVVPRGPLLGGQQSLDQQPHQRPEHPEDDTRAEPGTRYAIPDPRRSERRDRDRGEEADRDHQRKHEVDLAEAYSPCQRVRDPKRLHQRSDRHHQGEQPDRERRPATVLGELRRRGDGGRRRGRCRDLVREVAGAIAAGGLHEPQDREEDEPPGDGDEEQAEARSHRRAGSRLRPSPARRSRRPCR